MDREANYAAVGFFVVLVAAFAVAFVLWYSDSGDRREYQRYEVYFSGTVSGLSEGSAVRYLGVNVGRVVRIRLDPRNGERVLVLTDVDATTPIDNKTVARLSFQGITGVLFIDLAHDDGRAAMAPEVASQQYPVIRSVQSDFDAFVSGLPGLVAQATATTTRLNHLLADDNLRAVNQTLQNIALASRTLPATAADAAALMQDLRATAVEVHDAAASIALLVKRAGPHLEDASAQVQLTAANLARTTARLDRFLAEHEDDLSRFTGQGLAELEALLRESRSAAREFKQLSKTLNDDPSRLLYAPAPAGLEVPR
jgi:phospholipid/cholesterol/gamma-HCH transport system substrate-binding protein